MLGQKGARGGVVSDISYQYFLSFFQMRRHALLVLVENTVTISWLNICILATKKKRNKNMMKCLHCTVFTYIEWALKILCSLTHSHVSVILLHSKIGLAPPLT